MYKKPLGRSLLIRALEVLTVCRPMNFVTTEKIEGYAKKLSSATLDASHAGKQRVLDFTIKKGEWDGVMDKLRDEIVDMGDKHRIEIRITQF